MMKEIANDLVNDVVNEIDNKPPKIKIILKWVIRASIILIAGSFVFGQVKMSKLNRLDNIEKEITKNNKETANLKTEMESSFLIVNSRIDGVNLRIDKMYDDGVEMFNEYQEYNQKQLGLIIDHGTDNKDLIKEMINVNSSKQKLDVESQIIKSKNENNVNDNDDESSIVVVNSNVDDTTFFMSNARISDVDSIVSDEYRIVDMNKNDKGLYDVKYESR
ncbi:MAG: hypothetical protein ACOC2W_00980 [bacterium]